MLSLRNMRTLVALVEEGSFTQAALRLNVTQSGVSQQVAKLERSLGVGLISRGPSGAVPTPAGRQLYARCVAILREAAIAEAGVRGFANSMTGAIKIGLMPALTRCMMRPILRRFSARHRNVAITALEAVSTDLIERIKADDLDVAIVPVFDAPESMRCRAIGNTVEVVVQRGARHPLHMRPVELATLGPLKLILQSAGNIRRQRILAHLRASQIAIATLMDLDSMFGTLEFIENSDFVTVLPAIMVAPEIEHANVCVRPIDGFALELMAIESKQRPKSAVAARLVDEFEAELANLSSTVLITQASPQRSALRYQLDAKPLISRDAPVEPLQG